MIRMRALAIVSVAGLVALVGLTGSGRATRRRRNRVLGKLHHAQGRLRGAWYRRRGRHPDEHVGDLVLADRIRSILGPVEHRLDQPRVHVSVYRHVATLHGDVSTEYAADRLVDEVRAVCGVAGVNSRLHVGLGPGDNCPSDARAG